MNPVKLKSSKLEIAGRTLEWGSKTHVMGILNVTPDSFSGDGLLAAKEPERAAVQFGRSFVAAGADILDVGGESTRPGAEAISAEEELRRTVPVVRALAAELEVLISIDTYRAEVAAAALDAGAHLINDVWGLRADPELAPLAAERGVPVILMHNRSQPADASISDRLGGRYLGVEYDDLIGDVKEELSESVDIAHGAGISDERIILDPGIGFGKTVEQNLELLDRLEEVRALGYPVLVGTSRKSFIGYTLDAPPDDRVEGTAATVAIAIARGADIIRVHDVVPMVRVAKMADAVTRRRRR